MDRLQSMRVFAKVVEHGSFAKAGQVLDMSNAVVTRLVADLEDHLGARLLNRTTRKLSLTETGTSYLERVLQILPAIDDAETVASVKSGKAAGTLRVYAHIGFRSELARLLPLFAETYPDITLDITTTDRTPDLVEEGFDIGIFINFQKFDAGMVARKLANSSVLLAAAPAYLARHGVPRTPTDLARHKFLNFSYGLAPHGCPSRAGDEEALQPALVTRVVSNSGDLLRDLALSGMGLMFRPSFSSMDDLASGRLARLMPQECFGQLAVTMAYPSRRLLPAKMRSFVDFMLEHFPQPERDPWLTQINGGYGIRTVPVLGEEEMQITGPSQPGGVAPAPLQRTRRGTPAQARD
jgi:DNA-binding transcriptional LysR family regulator